MHACCAIMVMVMYCGTKTYVLCIYIIYASVSVLFNCSRLPTYFTEVSRSCSTLLGLVTRPRVVSDRLSCTLSNSILQCTCKMDYVRTYKIVYSLHAACNEYIIQKQPHTTNHDKSFNIHQMLTLSVIILLQFSVLFVFLSQKTMQAFFVGLQLLVFTC